MDITQLLCTAAIALSIGDGGENVERACRLMPEIVKAAEVSKVRPELVVAMIHYESRFKPLSISSAGACGLTQVLPKYSGNKRLKIKKTTCKELMDPKTSIHVGTSILSRWIYRYGKGNEKIGTCGYFAGYRCKGENPHAGGVNYSKKVIGLANKIKRKVRRLQRQTKTQVE